MWTPTEAVKRPTETSCFAVGDDEAGYVLSASSVHVGCLHSICNLPYDSGRRVGHSEVTVEVRTLFALRVTVSGGGNKGAPLSPDPFSPLAASFLRCALDRFHLPKPNTFPHNRGASVTTLRRRSGRAGMPFGFAGILKDVAGARLRETGKRDRQRLDFRNMQETQ
jgi:hypothetical protein